MERRLQHRGGAGCTQRQFEQPTDIRVDHYVEVDFSGFEGMVDAVGVVEVCIPQPIVDLKHGINIPAGTRKLTGREKRQQAFVASMVQQVINAKTLTNPIHLSRFLNAATSSLSLDEGLGSIERLADLGYQFRHIGPEHMQFLTGPWAPDPTNGAHVVEHPQRLRCGATCATTRSSSRRCWKGRSMPAMYPVSLTITPTPAGRTPTACAPDTRGGRWGSGRAQKGAVPVPRGR